MESYSSLEISISSLPPGTSSLGASVKEESTEGPQRAFNYDVVDVSKGFLTRIAYKKKVKASKLDGLLERRVKQHTLEERQRQQALASKPQAPTPTPATATVPAPGTPVRPRSPLQPLALAQALLTPAVAVKVEEKPSMMPTVASVEVKGETQVIFSQTVTPPTPDTTSKDPAGGDLSSPQNQTTASPQKQEGGLAERTMGPTGASLGCVTEPTTALPVQRSGETQNNSLPLDITKHGPTENAVAVATALKSDTTVTIPTSTPDQEVGQNATHFKPIQQSPEPISLVRPGAEENGKGPQEHEEKIQGNGQSRTESVNAVTAQPLSLLPQVNGKDGLENKTSLTYSVATPNEPSLTNSTQVKMNNMGKVEGGQVISLKGNTQQKSLVNGDMTPVNDKTVAEGNKSSLDSKVEVESKVTISDQEYQPPVKMAKLENNIEALGVTIRSAPQHNSMAAGRSPATKSNPVKIIRMPPSPIPSAEESSLSNDFAEENSNSGATEPLKTQIITQVTTTTTTTTVSKEMRIAEVSSSTSRDTTTTTPAVSTTESSAVSTLTTMTKTTVTKVRSPTPESQSEDSQSETVTQEHKTTLLTSLSKSTTDPSGKTSASSVAVSQELSSSSSTMDRIHLLKFSRTKKMRSDTALPSYRKFVTKSNRKSIFVLPNDDLRVLARRAGIREVSIFSYNAKPALDIWPYPSPRPSFGITWR